MGGQVGLDQVLDLTQVSNSQSKCKGASAAMVPWPFRLKFGWEMGTHPGRSVPMFEMGTPTPWVRGGQRVVLEACAAQMVHFCENFIKQKLKGNPENGGWVGLRICRGC